MASRTGSDATDASFEMDKQSVSGKSAEDSPCDSGAGLWCGVASEVEAAKLVACRKVFDVAAADAYGDRWWDGRNPDYRAFDNDCTNFVSQIMRAGGWKDKSGWYRSSENWWYNWANQTWTWGGAQNFFEFARKHRTESWGNVWRLQKGDAANLDFGKDGHKDHTMFVEGRVNGEPYFTYHTRDTNWRSLSNMLAAGDWWWYTHRTH